MFWLVHILVGGALGVLFDSWVLVGILAIVSHFILDATPHWDGFFDTKGFLTSGVAVITDDEILVRGSEALITSMVVWMMILQQSPGIVLFGAAMSLVPDALKIFYYTPLKKLKLYQKYLHFHGAIQPEISPIPGLLTQAVVSALALWILLW